MDLGGGVIRRLLGARDLQTTGNNQYKQRAQTNNSNPSHISHDQVRTAERLFNEVRIHLVRAAHGRFHGKPEGFGEFFRI